MKGILICGGTGSRLRPLTQIVNKSLLPVYDKPLICYPLQVLLDAGIREIAVVTGTEHVEQISSFLRAGAQSGAFPGCTFHFNVQERPGGIAQALGLTEEFVAGDSLCAILGDNIFFQDLSSTIQAFESGGHVFLKEVPDPERFGVAEVAVKALRTGSRNTTISSAKVLSIEEKPKNPKGNLAVTGCYLYDARCFDVIKQLQPSARGELEITDVSRWYLEQGELSATVVQEEWIDAGTFESLFRAAQLVREQHSRAPREQKP